jgi:hypothetical protein
VQGERRVPAADQHEAQHPAGVPEHELQVGGPVLAGQVGRPVEDEHDRLGLLGEGGGQAYEEGAVGGAGAGRRRQRAGELDAGAAQGLEDVRPERVVLAVLLLERDPSDRISGRALGRPRGHQLGLSGARGPDDQRHGFADTAGEALGEARPGHQEAGRLGHGELRLQQRIAAGGRGRRRGRYRCRDDELCHECSLRRHARRNDWIIVDRR